MRAENSLNHDKKRCVTSWLVQLEKEEGKLKPEMKKKQKNMSRGGRKTC